MIPKELAKKIRYIEIYTSKAVNDVLAGEYESVFKGRGMEFDEEFDVKMGDFFRNIFSNFDPGECGKKWSRDFADEVPHIMSKMANFGGRFGRMGEQISRQFHENRPGRGRDEEVKIVLNMLQEGKISAEEAERLINAIKAKKGEA